MRPAWLAIVLLAAEASAGPDTLRLQVDDHSTTSVPRMICAWPGMVHR